MDSAGTSDLGHHRTISIAATTIRSSQRSTTDDDPAPRDQIDLRLRHKTLRSAYPRMAGLTGCFRFLVLLLPSTSSEMPMISNSEQSCCANSLAIKYAIACERKPRPAIMAKPVFFARISRQRTHQHTISNRRRGTGSQPRPRGGPLPGQCPCHQ